MPENPPPPTQPARRRMPPWGWLIIAACAILAAALVFATVTYLLPAASEEDSGATQSPNPATTPSGQTPESAEQSAAPIVLPKCDVLIPDAHERAVALAERTTHTDIRIDDIGDTRFSELFGPITQTALGQTTQLRGCAYPDSLESYIYAYTSELSGEPQEAFIAALRADGDFTESTVNGAQVFVWENPLEGGHWNSAFTVHAFVGDVWIAGYGNRPAGDYVPTATAAILAANPQLQ